MIYIFDLDDTLYDEETFVFSGFNAVAVELFKLFGWDKNIVINEMINIFNEYGRGKIFNILLSHYTKVTAKLVNLCIKVYRYHKPKISIKEDVKIFLEKIKGYPKYIVTDGNKNVQYNKIVALGLENIFNKVYITHRYGIKHAKPSTYCFNLIRKNESADWKDLIYIGDNPYKDFVNLNPLGVTTIRVHSGIYADVEVEKKFDAKLHIESFLETDSLYLGKK